MSLVSWEVTMIALQEGDDDEKMDGLNQVTKIETFIDS